MVSVQENIANGVYEHKIPYSKENRVARRNEEVEFKAKFKNDLFEEFGVVGNNKAQKVFSLAWDYGHADGLKNIYLYFYELVDLIK